MKKQKKTSTNKLFLNKETITVLSKNELGNIVGGDTNVASAQDSIAIEKAKQDSIAARR